MTVSERASEAVARRPNGPLRHFVRAHHGYRQRGLAQAQHLAMPSPYLTVIFTLDEPLQVARHSDPRQSPETYAALLGGLHSSPALVVHNGAQSGIQLQVSPLADIGEGSKSGRCPEQAPAPRRIGSGSRGCALRNGHRNIHLLKGAAAHLRPANQNGFGVRSIRAGRQSLLILGRPLFRLWPPSNSGGLPQSMGMRRRTRQPLIRRTHHPGT